MFSLVLGTGFLYNWHVYRGHDDPLRGPDYMYRLIYDTLLFEDIWDFCNVVLFFDAAFTSFRLARALHDKRGIYFVGPINAQKPGTGGGVDSWPHQKFKPRDTQYLPRGWDRVAYTVLNGGWLQVTVLACTACTPMYRVHTHTTLTISLITGNNMARQ